MSQVKQQAIRYGAKAVVKGKQTATRGQTYTAKSKQPEAQGKGWAVIRQG